MQTIPQLEKLLRSNFMFNLYSPEKRLLRIISPEAPSEQGRLLIGPKEDYVLHFNILKPNPKKRYLVSDISPSP